MDSGASADELLQNHRHPYRTEKNQEGFYAGILKFVFVILFAIPLDCMFSYTQAHLALTWRVWMTERLLGQYFDHDAFYRLSRPSLQADGAGEGGGGTLAKLDNPDQRICQDVAGFTVSIYRNQDSSIENGRFFNGFLIEMRMFRFEKG